MGWLCFLFSFRTIARTGLSTVGLVLHALIPLTAATRVAKPSMRYRFDEKNSNKAILMKTYFLALAALALIGLGCASSHPGTSYDPAKFYFIPNTNAAQPTGTPDR